MRLSDALSSIAPTRGFTSVVSAVLSGDMTPVSGKSLTDEGLEAAKTELQKASKAQAEAKSDWAYWGYQGDVSYWRTVVNLLEAAQIAGADNLPEIPFDGRGGVVMDVCAQQERWGATVLKAARDGANETATRDGQARHSMNQKTPAEETTK